MGQTKSKPYRRPSQKKRTAAPDTHPPPPTVTTLTRCRRPEAATSTVEGSSLMGVAVTTRGALITAGIDGTVATYDADGSTLIGAHAAACNRVRAAADLVLSCSRDRTARLWRRHEASFVEAARFEGHALNVVDCALSADGRSVATGSRDYAVRVWDAVSGQQKLATSRIPRNVVTCLAWIPGSTALLAQGSEDLTLRVWDARDAQTRPAQVFAGYTYFPVSLGASSPDGHLLATGSKGFAAGQGCEVRVWDRRKATEAASSQHTLLFQSSSGHSQDVTGCVFLGHNVAPAETSSVLATCSKDGTLKVWDVDRGAEVVPSPGLLAVPHPAPVFTDLGVLDAPDAPPQDAQIAGGRPVVLAATTFQGGLYGFDDRLALAAVLPPDDEDEAVGASWGPPSPRS